MVVAISDNGIKMIIDKIDKLYGKHFITVQRQHKSWTPWVAIVGESTPKEFSSTAGLVYFLEGVYEGIQAARDNL